MKEKFMLNISWEYLSSKWSIEAICFFCISGNPIRSNFSNFSCSDFSATETALWEHPRPVNKVSKSHDQERRGGGRRRKETLSNSARKKKKEIRQEAHAFLALLRAYIARHHVASPLAQCFSTPPLFPIRCNDLFYSSCWTGNTIIFKN